MGIEVIADERGYYGRVIEAGETFEVPSGYKFSESDWFTRVKAPKIEKAKAGEKEALSVPPSTAQPETSVV